MPIDLTSYDSVQSNLFVKISIAEYRTTPDGTYTTQILRFSDNLTDTTIDGEEYLAMGNLMAVTSVNSELRVTGQEVTITVSGIPNTSIGELLYSKIKGSPVKIYRLFSDAVTGVPLDIFGNPMGRFQGIVSNLSLNEEYDVDTRTATNTLVLTCASVVDVLANKINARRTNPTSQNKYFPNDKSMDRVPTIENAYFDFGQRRIEK